MEVAANDAVKLAIGSQSNQSLLELIMFSGHVLDLLDGPVDPAPFCATETGQQLLLKVVESQSDTFAQGTKRSEERYAITESVALVAMGYQVTTAICRLIFVFLPDLNLTDVSPIEQTEQSIVISRNHDELATMAGFFQQLLNDGMVIDLPASAHRIPGIHDIADQIDRVSLVRVEKIQQQFGTGMPAFPNEDRR
nr:hypothetical protein [uncultured Cohaesibacter sp.]